LLREIVESIPASSRSRNDFSIDEGEGDCTSEMGSGQFSIFGAVEEKMATDFHGFKRIENESFEQRDLA
jgi:hypothetical protein